LINSDINVLLGFSNLKTNTLGARLVLISAVKNIFNVLKMSESYPHCFVKLWEILIWVCCVQHPF